VFVGYSEQAGSGYQKILSGWRGEHWADPFISDDVDDCQTFLTLKLNAIPATEHHIVPWEMNNNANGAVDRATESADSNTTETATEGTTESATETPAASTVERILQVLKTDPSASMKKLAQFCGITEDGVFYHIKQLKRKGRIRRVGPDYGGHWEVVS